MVGSTVRLQTRAARTPLSVGDVEEGGGPRAVWGGVARKVGVARAGTVAGPPAKRMRIGPKPASGGLIVPQLDGPCEAGCQIRRTCSTPPPPAA